jgi:CRP/FNR family transcriptional regulator
MLLDQIPAWRETYPQLANLQDAGWQKLLEQAHVQEIPAGTVLFHDGDKAGHYVLVLAGCVKVQKITESGREIVLYRVEAGETCVLTTTSLLALDVYPAEGVAETDITAVLINASTFKEAMSASDTFRQFVFSVYSKRLTDLIVLVEEVAFGRMDQRLAQWLMQHSVESNAIQISHQELAAELGTAREVISRLLKEFERRGLVALARRQVEVIDRAALEHSTQQMVL